MVVIRRSKNGALDTSFAGNGVATLRRGYPLLAVAAGGGKIAVAYGAMQTPPPELSYTHLAVARFNLDGSLDKSFGQSGVATPPYRPVEGLYGPADAAIQSDGRMLVSDNAGAVLRLTSDGALDPSFGGGDGVADVEAGGLALQPDGKILITTGRDQVTRLNGDGTPDATFGGGDGVAPFPARSGGLALQPDGRIVVSGAGASPCRGCYELVVARYTSDGQPDPGFGGGDGLVTASGVEGGPVAIQGERIVVQHVTDAADFEIGRYTSEGGLDPTFGGDGIVQRTRETRTEFFQQPEIRLRSLAVQPNGRLLAAGTAHAVFTEQYAAALLAFKSSGALDRSFGGGDGIVFTPGLVRCGERLAQIVGSTSADVITDNRSHNAVIAGLGGSDQIDAGDGDDLVCGGVGDDEIGGESGNDRVLGEGGEDLIVGGLDDDQLLGGRGWTACSVELALTASSVAKGMTSFVAAPVWINCKVVPVTT